MASVINTNISSLNAQRNLTTSASALTTSLQRLSSGLRINSAKDDAAGMAISSRMTSQINGLNQAARNANDGISLAQTAEGSLNAITDNLQRMRELAVQSSNASNSASDRATLQNEVSQLSAEIQRVASGAQFNGVNLLDGTFSGATFQVGANNTANDQITVSTITDARTSALGASYSATVTGSAVSGVASNGSNVQINGVNIITSVDDGVSTTAATGSAKALATAINGTAGTGGVTATASTAVVGTSMVTAALTGTITINGVNTASFTTGGGTLAADRIAVVAAINFISGATGVTATDTGADATGVTLAAADGRNVVTSFTTLTAASTGVKAASTNYGALTLTAKGSSGITASGTVTVIGSPTTTAATKTGTAIQNITVASASSSLSAIDSIDAALTSVNNSRASLGATQNRFASVVSNLMVTSENLTASRSRIQDADFAAETAAMTRGQILQQAGTAILAQANSLPNSVLSLLK
jgi:flagellin